jgi:hypothetical protein
MFGIGSTEFLLFAIVIVFLLLPKGAPSWMTKRNSRRDKCSLPRFALKDILASTGLIALGMAWISVALPDLGDTVASLELPTWLFVTGGAFIGAGALALIRSAYVGALVGASVSLLLVYTAASFGWPEF